MRKFGFIIIVALIFISSCGSDKKHKYAFTTDICGGNLYVETFTVFGQGAFGADLYEDYLTDSSNFRIYIGEVDSGAESYNYQCSNDSIIINKVPAGSDVNLEGNKRYYTFSELKKLKNFTK